MSKTLINDLPRMWREYAEIDGNAAAYTAYKECARMLDAALTESGVRLVYPVTSDQWTKDDEVWREKLKAAAVNLLVATVVVCSNCKRTIEGAEVPGVATSGFRRWCDGKVIICDACYVLGPTAAPP